MQPPVAVEYAFPGPGLLFVLQSTLPRWFWTEQRQAHPLCSWLQAHVACPCWLTPGKAELLKSRGHALPDTAQDMGSGPWVSWARSWPCGRADLPSHLVMLGLMCEPPKGSAPLIKEVNSFPWMSGAGQPRKHKAECVRRHVQKIPSAAVVG